MRACLDTKELQALSIQLLFLIGVLLTSHTAIPGIHHAPSTVLCDTLAPESVGEDPSIMIIPNLIHLLYCCLEAVTGAILRHPS